MERFRFVGPSTTRPLTVGDLQDARRNRRTDNDRKNDIIRLKSNANCIMARIDRALNGPAPSESSRIERRALWYGRHGGGRILDIR